MTDFLLFGCPETGTPNVNDKLKAVWCSVNVMSSVFKTNYPYALIHSKSIESSAFSLKKIDTSKSAECLFYTNMSA